MKKLAMLLALVMSCNIFAATTMASAATAEDSIIQGYDFEGLATGELAPGLLAKDAGAGGYVTIDDAHGQSMYVGDTNGFVIDRGASAEAGAAETLSFEVMRLNDNHTEWFVYTTASYQKSNDWPGSNTLVKLSETAFTTSESGVSVAAATNQWYKVDIVSTFTDAGKTVDVYIDGTKVSSFEAANKHQYINIYPNWNNKDGIVIDNVYLYEGVVVNGEAVATPEPTPTPTSTPLPEGGLVFDFEGLATGELPEGLTAYEGGANQGYTQIDAEHGQSIKMSSTAGFKFNFGETGITDTKTVSFEINRQLDANGEFMIFANNSLNYGDELVGEMTSAGFSFGYNTPRTAMAAGEWHQVDMVITGNGSSSTIDGYIDGVHIVTDTSVPVIKKLTFFGHWSSHNTHIDNLVIRDGEYVSPRTVFIDYYDFNTGSNKYSGASANFPTGLTYYGSEGNNWYNAYLKVDDEHGLSMSMKGDSGFYYDFGQQMKKSAAISFEFYAEDTNPEPGPDNNTWFSVDTTINKEIPIDGAGDQNSLVAMYGDGSRHDTDNGVLRFGGKTSSIEVNNLQPNTWHKIDIIMDYQDVEGEQKYVAKYYYNGEYKGESVRPELEALTFIEAQHDVRKYIDNLSIQVPYEASTITPSVSKKSLNPDLANNELVITFDKTIDINTLDETAITVKDANGNDVQITSASIKDTCTGVVLSLAETLDYAAAYTVTLPEGIESVFGDTCQTTVLNVTAAKDIRAFDTTETELATGAWTTKSYMLPETVSSGKVKLSFDYAVSGTFCCLYVYGTNTFDNGNQAFYWMGTQLGAPWDGTGLTYVAGEENHYDVIFDLDNMVMEVYMNGTQGSVPANRYATAITEFQFTAEANVTQSTVSNVRISYYTGEGEFLTDLTSVVNPATKQINITFPDAVDVDTLQTSFEDEGETYYNPNITLTSTDGQSLDLELVDATAYGVTVNILGDLQNETDYVLDLSQVKTLLGTDYKNNTVEFTAAAAYKANSAVIKNGDVALANGDAWDNNATYTVEVNVENETGERDVIAFVAGYSEEGLVGVQYVPITINATGTYTGNLAAMNLTGATSVKVFVMNDLANFAPIMDTPTSLSINLNLAN